MTARIDCRERIAQIDFRALRIARMCRFDMRVIQHHRRSSALRIFVLTYYLPRMWRVVRTRYHVHDEPPQEFLAGRQRGWLVPSPGAEGK